MQASVEGFLEELVVRRELAGECLAGHCARMHVPAQRWHACMIACASTLQPPSCCRHPAATDACLPAPLPAPPPVCADNYCFYVDNYDSLDAAYDWAKQTLQAHAGDKREFLYTRCGGGGGAACPLPPAPSGAQLVAQSAAAAWAAKKKKKKSSTVPVVLCRITSMPACPGACLPLPCREQWERGQTHDKLWNAAQLEMVHAGKMHGFMRMYWAKKILEWSASPEEALQTCIYLNDKYELDGRDPNGYVGAVGGWV